MDMIQDESVDLVVTSPPYPMIKMWDELFSSLNEEIQLALEKEEGNSAFELIHMELDKVWHELYRVMKRGSFACINIGDAVRSIGNGFRLYPNHSRIISSFRHIEFDCLPLILWRKQTNAPNKFMGSGMLPAGAYITLEHEYILIFRKGGKREFRSAAEKANRMRSGFFREERNNWFSDVWTFKGTLQALNYSGLRKRSAAFPLELCRRLVNMYSLYEDTVLDPFAGTGTTSLACIACGRSSIGLELDDAFKALFAEQAEAFQSQANSILSGRISGHIDFLKSYKESGHTAKYLNNPHGFKVVTRQETGIELFRIDDISVQKDMSVIAGYSSAGKSLSAG